MVISHSAARRVLPPGSPEPVSPRSLLGELNAAYPELPTHVVAESLDRAYAIEQALATGAEVALARVAVLARDRLDLLRGRANMYRHRTGHHPLVSMASPYADGTGRDELLCTYCRRPISADSFGYFSGMRQLVYATCPICERLTTMRASTWSRLSHPTQPTDQTAPRPQP